MNPFTTRDGEPTSVVWTPLRDPARWMFTAAVAAAGFAHVPVIGPHLAEAPYMGEEFIVLTVACVLLAVAALVCDSLAVWSLGAVTCLLAIAGYAATRLVAFPGLSDDVGNWLEPLGVLSVAAECFALAACAWVLVQQSRASTRSAARLGVYAESYYPAARFTDQQVGPSGPWSGAAR